MIRFVAAAALLTLVAACGGPTPRQGPLPADRVASISIDRVTVAYAGSSGAAATLADRLRDELNARVRKGPGESATLTVQITEARGIASGATVGTGRVAGTVQVTSNATAAQLAAFNVQGTITVDAPMLASQSALELVQARALADQIVASLYNAR
ncbi:hypothetical protein [Roseiterribacter gracilis]|uniref:Lipoprotein n=1 Tax=Roseiterribacter gracilis TaxID=2812848 RepID=A0A8S8X8M8_9PROT|nr:hypothetical protein TMPK1_12710 [Rhodospirillales bacterium TMPK1]